MLCLGDKTWSLLQYPNPSLLQLHNAVECYTDHFTLSLWPCFTLLLCTLHCNSCPIQPHRSLVHTIVLLQPNLWILQLSCLVPTWLNGKYLTCQSITALAFLDTALHFSLPNVTACILVVVISCIFGSLSQEACLLAATWSCSLSLRE